MMHSAFNEWFPFRKGACQMISPFWDILLVSIELGKFCWKIVMRQKRLLSYEYITPKICFQGCTQCQEFDFLIGPKDTVTPVKQFILSFSSNSLPKLNSSTPCILCVQEQAWLMPIKNRSENPAQILIIKVCRYSGQSGNKVVKWNESSADETGHATWPQTTRPLCGY